MLSNTHPPTHPHIFPRIHPPPHTHRHTLTHPPTHAHPHARTHTLYRSLTDCCAPGGLPHASAAVRDPVERHQHVRRHGDHSGAAGSSFLINHRWGTERCQASGSKGCWADPTAPAPGRERLADPVVSAFLKAEGTPPLGGGSVFSPSLKNPPVDLRGF